MLNLDLLLIQVLLYQQLMEQQLMYQYDVMYIHDVYLLLQYFYLETNRCYMLLLMSMHIPQDTMVFRYFQLYY